MAAENYITCIFCGREQPLHMPQFASSASRVWKWHVVRCSSRGPERHRVAHRTEHTAHTRLAAEKCKQNRVKWVRNAKIFAPAASNIFREKFSPDFLITPGPWREPRLRVRGTVLHCSVDCSFKFSFTGLCAKLENSYSYSRVRTVSTWYNVPLRRDRKMQTLTVIAAGLEQGRARER